MKKNNFKIIIAWIFIILALILFSIPTIYSIMHDDYTDMQILKKFWGNYISSIIFILFSSILLRDNE